MDAADLARVLRTGAAAVQHLPDDYPPPALLLVALGAMGNQAAAISRRGLADPPAPGWHRYLQPPDADEQPPETTPPALGSYWVIEVYYHDTTPVLAYWDGRYWIVPTYGDDTYVTWWAPIPVPAFGEAETDG